MGKDSQQSPQKTLAQHPFRLASEAIAVFIKLLLNAELPLAFRIFVFVGIFLLVCLGFHFAIVFLMILMQHTVPPSLVFVMPGYGVLLVGVSIPVTKTCSELRNAKLLGADFERISSGKERQSTRRRQVQ